MKKCLRKLIFNKNLLGWMVIFLLTQANLYGGIYPFGLPAFAVLGGKLIHIFAYFSGIIIKGEGVVGIVSGIEAALIFFASKYIIKNMPDYLRVGLSMLISGATTLLAGDSGFLLSASFILSEAAISMAFVLVLKKCKEYLSKDKRDYANSGVGFAFLIVTIFSVFLSFSDIDLGRLSLSASLMLFLGMVSAYKHKPSVSVAVNMGAGFFTMLFTPENVSSVAFLTISGFTASLLKKHGKFLIPVTYIAFFPLFLRFKINVTSYYLEDMVLSALLFLSVPSRFMEYVNIIPGSEKKESSYIKLSERISALSDTMYSVSEVFSGIEMRTVKKSGGDASLLTVNEVCKGCYFNGKCSEETRALLKALEEKHSLSVENKINCRRKKELLATFYGNLRALRMENVLENHITEENGALATQMYCLAEMLKDVEKRGETEIFRNEEAEREIIAALKRKGVKVKRILAGRNESGIFKVILEMTPCRGSGFCDTLVKESIENVLGFEVIRSGVKNCSGCRVNYSEVSAYKIENALASTSAEEISGDSCKFSYVDGEHFAVALSDGMGTGARAKYKSEVATELILRFLSAGMDFINALNMVNSLLLRQGGSEFATLDIALINLKTGEVEFSKNASASGYILRCGGKVNILENAGSPIGIVGKTEMKIEKCRLSEGDCLIMVSDGVSDCFDNEEELAGKIEEFTVGSVSEIADFIMTEALKKCSYKIKDDMTVVTVGCIKKQKSGKDKSKGGLVYEKRQKSNYIGQH